MMSKEKVLVSDFVPQFLKLMLTFTRQHTFPTLSKPRLQRFKVRQLTCSDTEAKQDETNFALKSQRVEAFNVL